jgi:hypothetical protein
VHRKGGPLKTRTRLTQELETIMNIIPHVRNGWTRAKECGKVGLALLMWMLGVPGVLVLLYLILG